MVVTIQEPPYVMLKCPECSGNDRYEGFAIDLLNRISQVKYSSCPYNALKKVFRRMSRDLSTGTFQHNVGEAGCQIFKIYYIYHIYTSTYTLQALVKELY